MKNKSKFIIIISIFVILIGLLSTFAYFTCKSTNNDISFTVSGVTVELNDGKDITGANLMPTLKYTSTGNINKPIKIRLKEETPDTVTVNINLKINTIDTGLKDSSFKYTLVSGNTIIKEGNFSSATNNSTITLATLTNTSTTNKLTTTTSTYTLYIWIDGTMDNPSTMMNKSFDFSLDITGSNSNMERLVIPANFVEELDDGTTGDDGSGVYKVKHSAIPASSSATGSELPAVTDYRYYGPSPNNYICLDMEGQSTCPDKHLYRIIGSIYEEKENTNRIKVIKATPLTDGTTEVFSWDYKVNNGSGSYDNIWATITSENFSDSLTSGSQLMKLLNSGAWWNGTSDSYYNGDTTAITVNFTNYKLSDEAKSYITTSLYFLGGYNNNPPLTNEMYGYERGTLGYNTDRPLGWVGMVGLMHPSDYGYAAGNSCVNGTKLYEYNGGCMNKDWLYISNTDQWLMTPRSGNSDGVFYVSSSGFVDNNGYSIAVRSVRPVFYLTRGLDIISGKGTLADPYLLIRGPAS